MHLRSTRAPSVQVNENLRCRFYNIVQKSKHRVSISNTIKMNDGSLLVECDVNFDANDYELLLWLVHKWEIKGQKDKVQFSTWELCKLKSIRNEQNNRRNLQKKYQDLLTLKLTFYETKGVTVYDFNGSYNHSSDLDFIDIDINADMKRFFTENTTKSVKMYIDQSMFLNSQLAKELYWYIQLNDTNKLSQKEQQSGDFEKAEYKLRGIPADRLNKDLSLQDTPETIKKLKLAFKELSLKTNYPSYIYKTKGKNDLYFRPTSPIEDLIA